MHGIDPKDGSRTIDWDGASADYALHRPGFPESFYAKLGKCGIGLPEQRILDLGTGTGTVARRLAADGSQVVGVDISVGQISEAKRFAQRDGLEIDFKVCSAEETSLADGTFDIIIAAQCWLYFDKERIINEVSRLLSPNGKLVTCHLCWLPRVDKIAAATERLILKHNPDWSACDWDGVVPVYPSWFDERMKLQSMLYYDEEIPFTHESWRGRIRASRGISATLEDSQVSAFDEEHQKLLKSIAPENINILHRIDAHIIDLNNPQRS